MRHPSCALVLLLALLLTASPGTAAEETEAPTTTEDVSIPVDQLELMVKPLTRSELQPELDAWYGLLREKAGAISAAQRSVKKTRQALDAADEDAAAAREALREAAEAEQEAAQAVDAPQAVTSDAPSEGAADESVLEAEARERKKKALADLSALQAEQTSLIQRMRVVMDSYQDKGGDVAEYEQYLNALQAVELDPSGLEATWAAVKGWTSSEEGGVKLAWQLAGFVGILLVTWLLARGMSSVTRRALEGSTRLSMLAKSLVERSVSNVVLALGFLVAVASLGVAVGPMLAALGAAGFIIGFALQGTLSNFASGLMILVYRPFDVGDVVEAGGVMGKVSEMNLVSTTFSSFDNQRIIVPNNAIWGSVITNVTANDVRRVDLTFGVAYDTDLDKAEAVLRDVVAKHEMVLDDPEPTIQVHELADSAVVFICRPWSRTEDYWTVYWDVTREVKRRFDAEGIGIPFPQREIHLRPIGSEAG